MQSPKRVIEAAKESPNGKESTGLADQAARINEWNEKKETLGMIDSRFGICIY